MTPGSAIASAAGQLASRPKAGIEALARRAPHQSSATASAAIVRPRSSRIPSCSAAEVPISAQSRGIPRSRPGTAGRAQAKRPSVNSARLVATGSRIDSLQVTLTFVVAGEVKHRERWGSSYELALLDSVTRGSDRAAGILRARLDSVLASVVVERLDARGVRLEAEDSATLARLTPRPAHRISFAYGFESTTRLVWDAAHARFVRLWSCC